MSVPDAFHRWRSTHDPDPGWGLGWYLANELCRRFYRSHGIVPRVLAKEGMGYYGITVNQLKCRASPKSNQPLGRFTMSGNVENRCTGSPGDHALATMDMLRSGASEEDLVRASIEHPRLSPLPDISRDGCRHHRWSSSYALLHEIATRLALRHAPDELAMWNDPAMSIDENVLTGLAFASRLT